jgi:hypothetical protein
MEFKGTQGKWESFQEYNWHEVLVKEPYKSICVINVNIEEHKANALLISKAPEMLDMLKDILESQESGETFHSYKIQQLIKEATEIN